MLTEGSQQLTDDNSRIEALRVILQHEQHYDVSYGEALEIGEALMRFFEVLADDRS